MRSILYQTEQGTALDRRNRAQGIEFGGVSLDLFNYHINPGHRGDPIGLRGFEAFGVALEHLPYPLPGLFSLSPQAEHRLTV